MSHTPGPWKIAHGCLPGDSGFSIESDNAMADRVKIVSECWPCTIVDEKHRQELFANARLIAAAPELLEALRLAHSIVVDAIMHGMPITEKVADCRNKCVAVLAKAEAHYGVPYTRHGWKSDVSEEWFSKVVDDGFAAIAAAESDPYPHCYRYGSFTYTFQHEYEMVHATLKGNECLHLWSECEMKALGARRVPAPAVENQTNSVNET